MSKLTEVLRLLKQEVRIPRARYALVHEGDPNEASLMATRDGYLNLAQQLIAWCGVRMLGNWSGWRTRQPSGTTP